MVYNQARGRILSEFVKVLPGHVLHLEIHVLRQHGENHNWFIKIHLQELLSLLLDVMRTRVQDELTRRQAVRRKRYRRYDKTAPEKKSETFTQPSILTGQTLRMAYSFKKKKYHHRHLLVNQFNRRKELGFSSLEIFGEKLVVYAYHLEGYTQNMNLESMATTVTGKSAATISSYFIPKEPQPLEGSSSFDPKGETSIPDALKNFGKKKVKRKSKRKKILIPDDSSTKSHRISVSQGPSVMDISFSDGEEGGEVSANKENNSSNYGNTSHQAAYTDSKELIQIWPSDLDVSKEEHILRRLSEEIAMRVLTPGDKNKVLTPGDKNYQTDFPFTRANTMNTPEEDLMAGTACTTSTTGESLNASNNWSSDTADINISIGRSRLKRKLFTQTDSSSSTSTCRQSDPKTKEKNQSQTEGYIRETPSTSTSTVNMLSADEKSPNNKTRHSLQTEDRSPLQTETLPRTLDTFDVGSCPGQTVTYFSNKMAANVSNTNNNSSQSDTFKKQQFIAGQDSNLASDNHTNNSLKRDTSPDCDVGTLSQPKKRKRPKNTSLSRKRQKTKRHEELHALMADLDDSGSDIPGGATHSPGGATNLSLPNMPQSVCNHGSSPNKDLDLAVSSNLDLAVSSNMSQLPHSITQENTQKTTKTFKFKKLKLGKTVDKNKQSETRDTLPSQEPWKSYDLPNTRTDSSINTQRVQPELTSRKTTSYTQTTEVSVMARSPTFPSPPALPLPHPPSSEDESNDTCSQLPHFSQYLCRNSSNDSLVVQTPFLDTVSVEVEDIFEDCFIKEELSDPIVIKIEDTEAARIQGELSHISAVADLTNDHLSYLITESETYLRNIFQGKANCRRHEDYKQGGNKRVNLNWQVPLGLFKEEQCESILEMLFSMFCKKHTKYLDYVLKVMFPEILIKIYMDVNVGVSHDEAENRMDDALIQPGDC